MILKKIIHEDIILKIGLLIVCTCIAPISVPAQMQPTHRIELPSSPNPVGSGARALGMGGAFIAIADDATAASWNPGGLIQLEYPEVSMVGASFIRSEDNSFNADPNPKTKNTTASSLNYFSAAYPFTFRGYGMILSLNYQHLYDFYRKASFLSYGQDGQLSVKDDYRVSMQGGLSAMGLAYCVRLLPNLSVGCTVNSWEDPFYGNQWEQDVVIASQGEDRIDDQIESFDAIASGFSRYSFKGHNANIGLFWRPVRRMTMGIVYKSSFRADLELENVFHQTVAYAVWPDQNQDFTLLRIDKMRLVMPDSYGMGVSYRFSDALIMALDMYRTRWRQFMIVYPDGTEISPISLQPPDQSNVDTTTQVRLGMEYALIKDTFAVPLRCGLFYDPAPADGSPDDYYGFSLSVGLAVKRFVFDIAYQYRFGEDAGEYILERLGYSQDLREHTVYASLIVYFDNNKKED